MQRSQYGPLQKKKKLIETVHEETQSLHLLDKDFKSIFKGAQKATGNHEQRTKENHENDDLTNEEYQ